MANAANAVLLACSAIIFVSYMNVKSVCFNDFVVYSTEDKMKFRLFSLSLEKKEVF